MCLTTIYSCGKELTSTELAKLSKGRGWVMFPEMTILEVGPNMVSIPRHPSELIKMLPVLINTTFVTVSDHLILMFLKHVRDGEIDPTELAIYCVDRTDFDNPHPPGRRIRVDLDGELIDKWPGGFFRERGELLF